MHLYCKQFVLIGFALTIGLLYNQYVQLKAPAKLPDFDLNDYWGPGDIDVNKDQNETVLQEIRYSEEPIAELRALLKVKQRFAPPLEGVNFEYGVNTDFLGEFVKYWRDNYLARWLSREVYFNRMPHYTTYIQGLRIHYVHTKATYDTKNKTIIPILLVHGWPGSVREFYGLVTHLANPDNPDFDIVFEVVAPSLPGFGYSHAPAKPGMGVAEMAVVLRNLMLRLNYDRFYIQGGDWGSALGSAIATIFPENVIGFHSNMCVIMSPYSMVKEWIASFSPRHFLKDARHESFHFPKSEKVTDLLLETGYTHLQATKPDTIGKAEVFNFLFESDPKIYFLQHPGIALMQNPIGLAAYILEKFSTWTDPANRALKDGGWSTFDEEYKDAILDNIMIYYLTSSITTSSRLYAEAFSKKQMAHQLDRVPTNVPVGCARFKNDLVHAMDWQLIDKYPNLVHSTYHRRGGHFIALENADLLFKDIVRFVKIVQKL